MISRRSFIGALFAPAVVRVADLMPIKALAVEPAPLLRFTELPPGIYNLVLTDLKRIENRVLAEYAASALAPIEQLGKQHARTHVRAVLNIFDLPPFDPRIGAKSTLDVFDFGKHNARTWVQYTSGKAQVDGVVTGRWERT